MTTLSALSRELSALVIQARPSVVRVMPGAGTHGSGVMVGRETLITCAHVVGNATSVVVDVGVPTLGRVVQVSRATDLAVVEVPPMRSPRWIELAPSVALGELVLTIGYPMGLERAASVGLVSAIGRSLPANGSRITDLIETDAVVSPGSSGGALINASGKLVGVVVARMAEASMGFAVPSLRVREVLASLTGNLGLRIVACSDGFVVDACAPGGRAAAAGLRVGDIIVSAGGAPLNCAGDLKSRVARRNGMPIEVRRGRTRHRFVIGSK